MCKTHAKRKRIELTKFSGFPFFLEGTTAILKIVGIVLGVLSAVCTLIGGCCKYHKSRDDNEPTVQGSENADAGIENLALKEQTTKM